MCPITGEFRASGEFRFSLVQNHLCIGGESENVDRIPVVLFEFLRNTADSFAFYTASQLWQLPFENPCVNKFLVERLYDFWFGERTRPENFSVRSARFIVKRAPEENCMDGAMRYFGLYNGVIDWKPVDFGKSVKF